MRTISHKGIWVRAKVFAHLMPLSLLLITATVQHAPLQAQQVERHRCWDIDIVPSEHGFHPTPQRITAADSGMMLVAMAKEYIGVPYRYGGRTPKAFDCAGFALYLYRHFGHDLPGWSGAQARLGVEVADTRNLQAGDLVFFGGRHNTKAVGHTGIVVGADAQTGVFTFIHAATHSGVTISRSTEEYYKKRYLTARRVFGYSSLVSEMKRR